MFAPVSIQIPDMAGMVVVVVMSLMWVIMAVTFSINVQAQGKKPPATFVLGDSLVDVGNNNYIFTLAAANHKPYGIDRPDKQATGRFCNGKIIPDLVSKLLHLIS